MIYFGLFPLHTKSSCALFLATCIEVPTLATAVDVFYCVLCGFDCIWLTVETKLPFREVFCFPIAVTSSQPHLVVS